MVTPVDVAYSGAPPIRGGRAAGAALPSWRPQPGFYSDISNNTLASVRPSAWGAGTEPGGPFITWNPVLLLPDQGEFGTLETGGCGHQTEGSTSWAGMWGNDLATGLWSGSNIPPQPMVEVAQGSTFFDVYSSDYYEVKSGPNAGFTYPTHMYTGFIYQSPAEGGGPKGSMLQVFVGGGSAKNAVWRFDRSQPNSPGVRVIDSITIGGATTGIYPMCAKDEERGGFWILAYAGWGPLTFVKFGTWEVTQFPGVEYSSAGNHSMIKIPAPYDCLICIGEPLADPYDTEVRVIRFVNDVPQVPVIVTQSGVKPTATYAGSPTPVRTGGVWSKILGCIVAYPGRKSQKVFRLTLPSPSTLATGTYAWTNETVVGDKGQIPSNPGGDGQGDYNEQGPYSGFQENVPARCFMWCKGINAPVQAWTLQGM